MFDLNFNANPMFSSHPYIPINNTAIYHRLSFRNRAYSKEGAQVVTNRQVRQFPAPNHVYRLPRRSNKEHP